MLEKFFENLFKVALVIGTAAALVALLFAADSCHQRTKDCLIEVYDSCLVNGGHECSNVARAVCRGATQ